MTISSVARLKCNAGAANSRRRLSNGRHRISNGGSSSNNSGKRNASGRISSASATNNGKLKRYDSVTGNSNGLSSRNNNACSINSVARRTFSVVRQISETAIGKAGTMINAGL